MQLWDSIPADPSQNYDFKSISTKLNSPSKIKERLIDNNIYFLEEGRTENQSPCLYFHAKTVNNVVILLRLSFSSGNVSLVVKTKALPLVKLTHQTMNFTMSWN